MAKQLAPHAFVIFGATGDLTRRKLLSAFAGLCSRGLAPPGLFLLGVARRKMDDATFTQWAIQAVRDGGFPHNEFCWGTHYQSLGEDEADYPAVARRLEELETQYETGGNRIFYLALPAHSFAKTIAALGEHRLHRSKGWTRLVIEKPFGTDLRSAQELKKLVYRYFDESQVFLIDHYLGKESVQNLLAFRFTNPIFDTVWNRDRVQSVQITVAEQLGLEDRAGYYESAGALRDMVQNHMTQLMALVGMEGPCGYNADDVRFEKNKLLRAAVPLQPQDAVFGQYVAGTTNDKNVPGYRDEAGVRPGSTTETFAALRVMINNARWAGVPFYLRTGKRLPQRISEIVVQFRNAPGTLLHADVATPNVLRVILQPDEGFALQVNVKAPGSTALRSLPLHFRYDEAFGPRPDAYETLLFDVMNGDLSLFAQPDSVETAWQLYAALLNGDIPVHPYPAGTWGPTQAESLLLPGHRWQ